MFPESEYDIQNNDLLHKIDQQCHNTVELLENVEQNQNFEMLVLKYIYINSIIHIL